MILLSSLITEYEFDFHQKYQDKLLPGHRNALAAMKRCRTEDSLFMLAQCESCDHQTCHPHSCGHRLCPHCQHHESQQWIERQRKKQLPTSYFMITFTLPAQLRSLAWQNQREIYALLLKLGWQTLKSFGLKDKKLQGNIGATGVLHTHSRELNYHPHVHFIVPAGAVDAEQQLWRKKNGKYLFKNKNLAKVFRAKWFDAMKAKDLMVNDTLPKNWVVDCQYVGQGDKALTYLGKYLYRGVLPEKNIIANQNGNVTFCYTNNKKIKKKRTLSGADFLWLLLKHVLPRGFRRARDYGLLHSNNKRLIALVQTICRIVTTEVKPPSPRATFCCHHCGGKMKIIATRQTRLTIPWRMLVST